MNGDGDSFIWTFSPLFVNAQKYIIACEKKMQKKIIIIKERKQNINKTYDP